jgi:hypothetical protein
MRRIVPGMAGLLLAAFNTYAAPLISIPGAPTGMTAITTTDIPVQPFPQVSPRNNSHRTGTKSNPITPVDLINAIQLPLPGPELLKSRHDDLTRPLTQV